MFPSDRTRTLGRSLATWMVFLALAAAPGGRLSAGAEPSLPYRVAVEVLQGNDRSAEGFRDGLLEVVLLELRRRGCAPSASAIRAGESPQGDLLLQIVLDEVAEDMSWSIGISDRAQRAGSEESSTAGTAVVEASAHVDLVTLPTRKVVRSRKFRISLQRQPLTPGEDPKDFARAEAQERIAREARTLLCGARRRLERDLRIAREPSDEASSAR